MTSWLKFPHILYYNVEWLAVWTSSWLKFPHILYYNVGWLVVWMTSWLKFPHILYYNVGWLVDWMASWLIFPLVLDYNVGNFKAGVVKEDFPTWIKLWKCWENPTVLLSFTQRGKPALPNIATKYKRGLGTIHVGGPCLAVNLLYGSLCKIIRVKPNRIYTKNVCVLKQFMRTQTVLLVDSGKQCDYDSLL